MVATLNRWIKGKPRVPSREKLIIDDLSRQLDIVEKQVPMINGYQRIDPYVRDYKQGNIDFSLIIYHTESKAWFDNDHADSVVRNAAELQLVRSGDTVFDLGCNAGFLTAWFAKQTGPTGRVVGFDPFPWNTLATYYSAKLNGCDNVTCHTVGIASRYGEVKIPYVDSKIYENSALEDHYCFWAKLVPLDEYAAYRPDFIKVDIEGAERELIAGAAKIFAQNPKPQWMFELHHQFIRDAGSDPDAIGRELLSHGYTCRIQDAKDGVLFTADSVTPDGCALFAIRNRNG
jgi:FkbM family methyltransferase